MTNERELLELAAKAAGIDGEYSERANAIVNEDGYWMPLDDDGDALRLAVDMKMDIQFGPCSVETNTVFGMIYVEVGSDPYAATRLAITRAAAEIGRSI